MNLVLLIRVLWPFGWFFPGFNCPCSLRPQSPAVDPAEVSELRRLRDRLALISPDRPLDQLQLIATLGMGGFGRVELVRTKIRTGPGLEQ